MISSPSSASSNSGVSADFSGSSFSACASDCSACVCSGSDCSITVCSASNFKSFCLAERLTSCPEVIFSCPADKSFSCSKTSLRNIPIKPSRTAGWLLTTSSLFISIPCTIFSEMGNSDAHALLSLEKRPSHDSCWIVLARTNAMRSEPYCSTKGFTISCFKCIPSKFCRIVSSTASLHSLSNLWDFIYLSTSPCSAA